MFRHSSSVNFPTLLCCLSVLTLGVALAPPHSSSSSAAALRWTIPLSSSSIARINHLSLCMDSNANGGPCRIGIRQKFSSKIWPMMRRKIDINYCERKNKSECVSLVARRPPSERKLPTLLQHALPMLIWRLALLPNVAQASSSTAPALSQSPAMAIGRRRILNVLQSIPPCANNSLRKINKQKIKLLFTTGVAILAFMNVIETIKANRRQKLDPTSEWGRYADNPSARGMALTILLMRLIPYAVLPGIIEKITKKSKTKNNGGDEYIGYSSKEEYESSRAHKLRTRGGQLFADGLLRLGPLYIKIGQILSCRENLFPDEWMKAMTKLQDRVPAKSGREAWELLYEACPGGKAGFHQQFMDFDDVPLAAASLGQVHKARLRSTNESVAIKIQRARLRDIYDKDLALMKKIAKIADSLGKAGRVGGIEQSWEGIFSDAETILYREIDYRDEAENAIRFANDFGIGLGGVPVESTAKGLDGKKLPSAAEWMRTPYTYAELSSEKFLVMEYVPR